MKLKVVSEGEGKGDTPPQAKIISNRFYRELEAVEQVTEGPRVGVSSQQSFLPQFPPKWSGRTSHLSCPRASHHRSTPILAPMVTPGTRPCVWPLYLKVDKEDIVTLPSALSLPPTSAVGAHSIGCLTAAVE